MTDKVFVDTNIFVYAHDLDAGEKHDIAKDIVEQLWESRTGVLSTQVLQEFYVTLTRKIHHPLDRAIVRRIIQSYCQWELVINTEQIILQAAEIEEAYQISFWDALIFSAATSRNAAILLSEDLNHGRHIEGVLIKNPFLSRTSWKS